MSDNEREIFAVFEFAMALSGEPFRRAVAQHHKSGQGVLVADEATQVRAVAVQRDRVSPGKDILLAVRRPAAEHGFAFHVLDANLDLGGEPYANLTAGALVDQLAIST